MARQKLASHASIFSRGTASFRVVMTDFGYPMRRALISTHMDLGIREKPETEERSISTAAKAAWSEDAKGRMEWSKIHGARGNTPQQMWNKLSRKHATIGFVFSGAGGSLAATE